MNSSLLLSVFAALCCIASCYVSGPAEPGCASSITAFPPDPKSRCCGVEVSNNKIIGGEQPFIDQYPWLALLEYQKNGTTKLLCGGTLISSRYVLTAAHCVTGHALMIGDIKNIRLGEYDTRNEGPDCMKVEAEALDCTDGSISIPIEKIIPHPEYTSKRNNKDHHHDIALIRLAQNAPYTDFVRPICLPSTDVSLKTEKIYLTKAGWGTITGLSPITTHVRLPLVPLDQCQKSFADPAKIKLVKSQMCAGGEKGKDSCLGDAGMPLIYTNEKHVQEAAGIVSFGGSPCGRENVPSVYTNVYEYKSWINDNIVA